VSLVLVGAALSAPCAYGQIAVIANPDVPVDSMNRSKIVDLFTGDVRLWGNGVPVVPIDLQEPKEVRKSFYKELGKSSARMRSIWMKKKLSGEGDPPEAVETEDEVVARVAATPGSISFVRASRASKSVKIIRILQ
jgi:ABC-type phosphate transport system substrate-binding protein